jgi:putative iron-dependent peroxidase
MEAPRPVATAQVFNDPPTRDAIFLVMTVRRSQAAVAAVRDVLAGLSKLVRAVGARDVNGRLSCVVAIGADGWESIVGLPRPSLLHAFMPVVSGPRRAVATPGDLLFHMRAERMDLCFELASQVVTRLSGSMDIVDEVHGFRYFDDRDLTGFVDGTENPAGQAAFEAAIVGDEEPGCAGGSYVMVQKYVHDLASWSSLSTEDQERIIGRTKLSDIELDDAAKPAYAHNALTTIVEDGIERKIIRRNMPFGDVGGSSGTYFIGYARSLLILEQMIRNMFIGDPPGTYDRLLDFTHAVTGTNFFAPSVELLESLAGGPD